MRAKLAYALQGIGLIVVPLGLVHGFVTDDVKTELIVLVSGAALFAIGKLIVEPRGS